MVTPLDLDKLAAKIAEIVAEKLASRPRLVDRVELCRLLGLGESSIDRLTKRGQIPSIRAGRRVLYEPNAVIAALSAGKTLGVPE